jgi:hypothetical protein
MFLICPEIVKKPRQLKLALAQTYYFSKTILPADLRTARLPAVVVLPPTMPPSEAAFANPADVAAVPTAVPTAVPVAVVRPATAEPSIGMEEATAVEVAAAAVVAATAPADIKELTVVVKIGAKRNSILIILQII